ncbi:hypothetical protein GCM10023258_36790 [Terrabacter aeriphilus]|uniref:Uncharacterized protein n=1 Tax=Terrabacter aeriphilus TaxID=515662 RepID=A0ABP9JML9_9MICO
MDDRRDRLHALTTEAARVRVVVATLLTSLVATLVVLLATTGDASPLHVLVTAGAVGLLAIALTARQARPVGPVPVRARPSGVAGAVPASTAYWCAVDAPRCPRRPRAPGRR